MRYVSNHTSATKFIMAREPFKGNSMSGSRTPRYYTGRLTGEWRDVYYHTAKAIDYIVYSFATPIAWHLKNGLWIIPGITYSGYTSRHQQYVLRAAMGENDWHARLQCDNYYFVSEIMEMIHAYDETGRAPIHHTNRQRAYVTVRGILPGDYLFNVDEGRWLTVYRKEKRRGVLGKAYWVAIHSVAGRHVTTYIGDASERVGRLR